MNRNKRPVLLLVAALASPAVPVRGDAYRFTHTENLGLTERVFDKAGRAYEIIFSTSSSAEALAVLGELVRYDVYGTSSTEISSGVPFDQKIMVEGELGKTEKKTEDKPLTIGSEAYRDFTLKSLNVYFPVVRGSWKNEVDMMGGYYFLETHFSFQTLLPEGVIVGKRAVDLKKFEKNAVRPQ